jgi:outer membrane receptor protein involved in Fe transport
LPPRQLLDADGNPQPGFNNGSLFTFNPNNQVVAGFPVGSGFNRNAERRISVPVERYMGTVIANFEVSDGIKLYAEGTYVKVKSSSQIEATPLDYTDIYADGQGIPLSNAFIPTSVRDQINAYNASIIGDDDEDTNPVTSLGFRRRQVEVFSRSNTAERDFYRGVVGIKGDITDKWNFDVSYVYGRMKDFTASQDIDNVRYSNALDTAVIGGQVVCASAAARAEGCVPINLFGYNTASPEASAYVQSAIPKSERVTNTQHVFSATISGSPFSLPGGDLGIAIGAEYRKDKSIDDLDELTNVGGNSGNAIPDIRGTVTAKEVFGEIRAPILADTPFFYNLELTAAARYSDYSGKGVIANQNVKANIGTVFSWNVGANWEVFRGVKLRASYAEANRAPNIGELFSSPSETFPGDVNDPCIGVSASAVPGNTTAAQAAACRALPGFAANLAQSEDGKFFYTLADIQGINGFDGGNVALTEETAKTLNLGLVVNPPGIRGLSFSVDYFRIKISDAIDIIPRDESIANCLEGGLPEFCNNVIRDPRNGRVLTINAQNLNVASVKTEGVDFNLNYATPLGLTANDSFSANINYTYLIALEKTSFVGSPVFDNKGLLYSGPDGGRLGAGFKHKATGRFSYKTGPVTLSWQTTYLGKITDDRAGYDDVDLDRLNKVGAKIYNDAQLRFAVDEDRFEFYVGVDNVFDVDPPFLPSGFSSNVTGTETAADTYDPFGRRLYAGFQAKF